MQDRHEIIVAQHFRRRNRHQLDKTQQNITSALAKFKVHVLYRVQRVYNGIALTLDDPSQLAELAKLPGVKAVHRLVPKRPADASSAALIGAPQI